jgi:hypothetical protein
MTFRGLGFGGDTRFEGDGLVWTSGLPDDGVLHMAPFGLSTFGYPSVKVMWLIGPGIVPDVTLAGRELSSLTPMRFEIYPGISGSGSTRLVETATLDPYAPNRDAGMVNGELWSVWGLGLDFPTNGCYQLDVSYRGGSWSTTFAAQP